MRFLGHPKNFWHCVHERRECSRQGMFTKDMNARKQHVLFQKRQTSWNSILCKAANTVSKDNQCWEACLPRTRTPVTAFLVPHPCAGCSSHVNDGIASPPPPPPHPLPRPEKTLKPRKRRAITVMSRRCLWEEETTKNHRKKKPWAEEEKSASARPSQLAFCISD